MSIMHMIQDRAWALHPAKLDEINAFIRSRVARGLLDEPDAAEAAAVFVRGRSGPKAEDEPYQVERGVAVIEVVGTISKRANMLSTFSGGTSTELIGKAISKAVDDPQVAAIMLDIESPGGSVDGTKELADRVAAAAKVKPVIAFANGLMASAAYWIGSGASAIVATETAIVGSIGVALTHFDQSEADAKDGVKRTEIFAGRFKRIASDSQPLSSEGRAYLQEKVDTIYALFVDSVAANRRVTREHALAMADGRDFIGAQALAIGLVDLIGNRAAALALAVERSNTHMDIKTLQEKHPEVFAQAKKLGAEEVQSATEAASAEAVQTGIDQERARVVALLDANADPAATISAIKSGTPTNEAFKAFFEAERQKRLAAPPAGTMPTGAAGLAAMAAAAPAPVGTSLPNDVTAQAADFETKVGEAMAADPKLTKAQAQVATAKKHPALYQAFIDKVNS